MLPAGIVLGWVAYAVGSYGWVLLRGWDIPFRAWVSPLNPYQFPSGGPGPIPDTQLFPSSQITAPGKVPFTPADPNFWKSIGQTAANPFGG